MCTTILVPVIETDGTVEKPDMSEAKIVVAMVSKIGSKSRLCDQVGLPARGKSYLSNKLMRYLRVSSCRSIQRIWLMSKWLEFNVEVFNVGQLRRSQAKAEFEA